MPTLARRTSLHTKIFKDTPPSPVHIYDLEQRATVSAGLSVTALGPLSVSAEGIFPIEGEDYGGLSLGRALELEIELISMLRLLLPKRIGHLISLRY